MFSPTRINPCEEEIRLRSYLIWEREGRREGRAEEYWLRAQKELDGEWRAAIEGKTARYVLPRPFITSVPIRRASGKTDPPSRAAA